MKTQAGSYPTVDRSEGHTCFRDWEGGRNITYDNSTKNEKNPAQFKLREWNVHFKTKEQKFVKKYWQKPLGIWNGMKDIYICFERWYAFRKKNYCQKNSQLWIRTPLKNRKTCVVSVPSVIYSTFIVMKIK